MQKKNQWRNEQSSNEDTDIEDRLVDTAGEGGAGTNWESSMETYTLLHVK